MAGVELPDYLGRISEQANGTQRKGPASQTDAG